MSEDKRFFTSKEEIMTFFQIKEAVFKQFLKLQMPVMVVNGRYYAYPSNLEVWFKTLTSKQRQEIVIPDA